MAKRLLVSGNFSLADHTYIRADDRARLSERIAAWARTFRGGPR